MTYQTKQHQALLECLRQNGTQAVSVGALSQALRQAGCPVGTATIYRHLERLEQAGQIHKISTDEGALFQYCPRSETHRDCFLIQCERCGRILHINCSHLVPLYDHLEQEHHFRINPRKTVFTGLCEACAAKEERSE